MMKATCRGIGPQRNTLTASRCGQVSWESRTHLLGDFGTVLSDDGMLFVRTDKVDDLIRLL